MIKIPKLSKIKLKSWIIFFISIFVVWFLFPQYSLNIRINSDNLKQPQFYITTKTLGSNGGHSIHPGFKILDRRLISANKTQHLFIRGNLRPILKNSKFYLDVKHPEYRKVNLTTADYRGALITINPQHWDSLLIKNPKLELDSPKLVFQPVDYQQQLKQGNILRAYDIRWHLAWVLKKPNKITKDQLGVLNRLVQFVEVNSIGRTDVAKSSREHLDGIATDIELIRRQAE